MQLIYNYSRVSPFIEYHGWTSIPMHACKSMFACYQYMAPQYDNTKFGLGAKPTRQAQLTSLAGLGKLSQDIIA